MESSESSNPASGVIVSASEISGNSDISKTNCSKGSFCGDIRTMQTRFTAHLDVRHISQIYIVVFSSYS